MDFVAVIVAAIVAAITLRQYAVSRDQMRLALFDRRLDVYEKVYDFLSKIQETRNVDNQLLSIFYDQRHKAKFLFGEDVNSFLTEVLTNVHEKQSLDSMAEASKDSEEEVGHIKKEDEHYTWIVNAKDKLHKKFLPYLAFPDQYKWPNWHKLLKNRKAGQPYPRRIAASTRTSHGWRRSRSSAVK